MGSTRWRPHAALQPRRQSPTTFCLGQRAGAVPVCISMARPGMAQQSFATPATLAPLWRRCLRPAVQRFRHFSLLARFSALGFGLAFVRRAQRDNGMHTTLTPSSSLTHVAGQHDTTVVKKSLSSVKCPALGLACFGQTTPLLPAPARGIGLGCSAQVRRCGLAIGVLPCCAWLRCPGQLLIPALVLCLVCAACCLGVLPVASLLALCVRVGSAL